MTLRKTLSLALALVMLISTFAVFGAVNVSALSGVGTSTSFQLSSSNYTFGCDISTYNVLGASVLDYSRVDFAKMKASGCDFVILRLGLNHSSNHACQIDKAFLGYYERARAAGMQLGAYFYSRARTAAEATTEANFVISTIEDNNLYFEYPIYYDVESEEQVGGTNPSGATYTALSNSALETVCTTFMTKLENAGYFPAMYCMKSLYTEKFSTSFKSKYDFWGAHVKNPEGADLNNLKTEDPYEYDYSTIWGMWQYSWYGHKKFSGYTYDSSYSQLDVNICYKDYPALMKQYGYNNCVTPSNGSLVAGKTPTITGSYLNTSATGSGLTDGKYSSNLEDGTWLALGESNVSGGYAHFDYDLGAKYSLTDAKIHIGTNSTLGVGRPYDCMIEVSDDKVNWTKAESFTLTTGTWADGGHTFTISSMSAAGRYVRIKAVLGGSWWYINEIVINGTPYTGPSTPSTPSTNGSLVAGKSHSITGNYKNSAATGSGLTDGKYSTNVEDGTWLALDSSNQLGSGDYSAYVNINYDLGAKYTLSDAKMHFAVASNGIGRPYDVQVHVSDDNKNWTKAGAFTLTPGAWAEGYYTVEATGLNGSGRYVRFVMVNAGWVYVNEIVLNGTKYVETPDEGNKTLAANATITLPNASNANYNASLNDGKAADYTKIYEDGAWYGFEKGKTADAETGYAEIIIDLGARYDITQVRLHLANDAAAGICNPWDVRLSVSDSFDGPYTMYNEKEFGTLKTTDATDTANTANLTSYWSDMPNITGITGRYVKISFYVGGSWMFINEVEVNGTPSQEIAYEVGDVDNDGKITADDYIVLKRIYFGTATLASLNVPETASARCDVNNDGEINADDYIFLKRVYFGTATI